MSVSILTSLWRTSPRTSLTSIQKHWLTRPGALTQGLRKLGKLDITILSEHQDSLCLEDSLALQRPERSSIWVREIVMSIDGIPCVWARSITPIEAAQSVWKGIRRLSTRPLAEMLYHDVRITRSPFDCAPIYPSSVLYHRYQQHCHTHPWLAVDVNTSNTSSHYARRSVFYKSNQPLMVTECFLPTFWALPQQAYY